MAANCYMTRSKKFTPKIQHDVENTVFFIELGTSRAYLSYQKSDKILVMEHTEVPAEYAGKGLGKILAKVCLILKGLIRGILSCTPVTYTIFLFYV